MVSLLSRGGMMQGDRMRSDEVLSRGLRFLNHLLYTQKHSYGRPCSNAHTIMI